MICQECVWSAFKKRATKGPSFLYICICKKALRNVETWHAISFKTAQKDFFLKSRKEKVGDSFQNTVINLLFLVNLKNH